MMPTENRALAEARAVRIKLRGFHDILLMREAICSVRLSRLDDWTDESDDDDAPSAATRQDTEGKT